MNSPTCLGYRLTWPSSRERLPQLSDGGKRLAESLTGHGIESEPVMWNDPSLEWGKYEAALVRSCWDYPDDRDRFRALLGELQEADLTVFDFLPALKREDSSVGNPVSRLPRL